jgi:hypothetical protein
VRARRRLLFRLRDHRSTPVHARHEGQPLNAITLGPGEASDTIVVRFTNPRDATWDRSVVLAYWNGSDDGPPADASQFCHSAATTRLRCAPGIPASIGDGPVQPRQNGEFQFQLRAPHTAQDFTLYFRPAHRTSDGTYEWINQPSGARTYDYFSVHVDAGCPTCQ